MVARIIQDMPAIFPQLYERPFQTDHFFQDLQYFLIHLVATHLYAWINTQLK